MCGSARRLVVQPGPATAHGRRSRPSGPSGALHTGGAWLLMCGSVRRLVVRPGPTTAHGHRSQALRTLRRSPHRRCSRNLRLSLLLAAPLVFRVPSGPAARKIATREPAARSGRSRSPPVPSGPSGTLHTGGTWSLMCGSASARSPARTLNSARASEISRVKPVSPLLACMCVGLKPPSPLRARNRCFGCVFRLQWCCRFQWSLFGGEQWCRRFHAGLHQWLQRCHWFHSRHVAVSCARKCSPCVGDVGASAKMFALRAQKGPQLAFDGVLGEFFATMPLEGLRWANVVAPLALLACHATIRGPGQACRQPTTARPKQTARDRRKRTARPRIMRGRAAIRRIKQQHATQSLQTALRP